MNSEYPLVWVHLGPAKIPRHLKESLNYHSRQFSNQKLILIVDHDRNYYDFGIKNLKVVQVPTLDLEWEVIQNNMEHDLTFRKGFWFTSLARFKAIAILMSIHQVERLLHVESDVVLMPNFPFDKFHEQNPKLAYSLEGEGQGIASILYVGSQQYLEDFLNFTIEETESNPLATDMTVLYGFFLRYPNQVDILPSLIRELHSVVEFENTPKALSERVDYFGGIFDPISIGQFLLGIDPRNNKGVRILYRQEDNHYLKMSKLQFRVEKNVLFLIKGYKKYPVFTLHVHSKDPRAFSQCNLFSLLNERLESAKQGEKSEFIPKVFANSLFLAVMRRLSNS